MRTHHIIAFKDAAQNAVGAVIHHAEQCRAYIRECREHALIEYCASTWWMTTHKDAIDQNEYEVSVTAHASHISRCWTDLEIVVKTGNAQVVWRHPINDEIAKFILTEEAIRSFEWDEEQRWYDAQQEQQAQEQDQESAEE
jgi:hypothetical protein